MVMQIFASVSIGAAGTNGNSSSGSTITLVTAAAAGLIGVYYTYSYLRRRRDRFRKQESCNGNPKSSSSLPPPPPPPKCPSSLWETYKSLSANEIESYVMKNYRALNGSTIFRIPLPVLGAPMVVVVGDGTEVRSIQGEFLTYKPTQFYDCFKYLTGRHNILSLTTNDKPWSHRRKALNPAFASQHVKRMNQVLEQVVDRWMEARLEQANGSPTSDQGSTTRTTTPSSSSTSVSFEVGHEMVSITLAAISKAAFGYDLSPSQEAMFLKELPLALDEYGTRAISNPLRKIIPSVLLPDRRRAFLATDRKLELAYEIMRTYRDREEGRSREENVKDTVLDRIMKNSNYVDDDERAADIIIFLFAGHDTTGFTLAWILLELAKNPDKQQALLESLQKKDGSNEDSSYLMAVIKEGMRLNTIFPVQSVRQLGKDHITTAKTTTQTDIDGNVERTQQQYRLPKGTVILPAPCIMLQNPAIFPDPETFQPERWLDNDDDENDNCSGVTEAMKESFLPFATGKRNCIGQPLAMVEIRVVLTKLIQRYTFDVETEGRPVNKVVTRPEGTILRATKRKDLS